MLDILTDIITVASALGLFGVLVARWLPNEKLHSWGQRTGQFLDSFGKARVGTSMWNKLEDFLVNSLGQYLGGVKEGLKKDDDED